jgi:hypothetical protein
MAKKRRFSNVPAHLQGKMERCVQSVKRQGRDKESAIAICFESVVRGKPSAQAKKEFSMGKARQKRKARRKKRLEQARLKAQELLEQEELREIQDEMEELQAEAQLDSELEGRNAEDVPEIQEYLEQQEAEEPIVEEAEQKDIVTALPSDVVVVQDIGPTSFSELDAEREARERAWNIKRVTYDAEDILSNIVRNIAMELDEKATAIKKVAEELPKRVDKASKKPLSKGLEEKAERLELELVLKEISFPSLLLAWAKAKLTSATRNDLPDSAFACILPGGKKDASGRTVPRNKRRFPIHDKAHVYNALARLPQAGGDIASCARPKVLAAARKMGIGKPAKKDTGIMVFKDEGGDWRWIGWFTNKFQDREGEILSSAAHKEYAAFLEENPGLMPEFRIWHRKGTARAHRPDYLAYQNGFVMTSGKLTTQEAIGLMTVARKEAIGMSHGFFAVERDPDNPKIITKYRTFEVSDLPQTHAANPWTPFAVLQKEARMTDKQEQYFRDQVGDEFFDELVAKTAGMEEALEEAQVPNKALETEVAEEETKEESTKAPDGAALATQIAEALHLGDLSAFVEETKTALKQLTEEVGELKKSDDEKIADQIAPAKPVFAWTRVSEKGEELTEEENKAIDEKAAETEDWFVKAHEGQFAVRQ